MKQETQLEAFNKIKVIINGRRKEVYETIKKLEYCTNSMIARKLNLPINCVTGRCKELRDMNLVKESHVSWCPITHSKCKYWQITGINQIQ